ncbi:MAG: calcium-binding protein, partial [Phenylobacterium sp.]|uniref:beta strand repeat-containing protein n=1 Tax=Phenylobacterium sp. TaxID=1871053 RepID=UPI0025DE7016
QAWAVSGTAGGGTETLAVTAASATSVSLSSLTGLSNLTLTLTGAGGAETLTGSSAADQISGLAGNDTLTGGGGADILDGGGEDDTFVYSGTSEAASGEAVDGGTGTDTVRVAATTDLSAVTFSTLEAVSLADGVTATFGGGQLHNQTWSVNGTALDTTETLVVNAASGSTVSLAGLTGLANLAVTLTGAGGTENLTGSTAADSISGLVGNDTLNGDGGADTLGGGAGADSVTGGLGDDVFVFAGTSEVAAGDAVDGTSGTDTVLVTATTDLTGVTFSHVDAVSLADGVTATFTGTQISGQTWAVSGAAGGGTETLAVTAASATSVSLASLTGLTNLAITLTGAGGAETLTGSSAADQISGQAGNDTLTGGAGADILSGGADDDTFIYAGTSEVASGEQVDGVSGTDTVRVTATTNLTGVTFSNIDAVSLADGVTATFTGTQISGQTWAVSGAAGGGTETLAVTAASGDSVNLSGLTGLTDLSVTLTGAGGAETLTGSSAADRITGGAGADSLTGGGGADVFVFGTTDSGLSLVTADTITDFTSATDTLGLGLAGDGTAGTGNYVESGSAVADFAAALAAADAALSALNGTAGGASARLYAFQFDAANGYLFIDTDSDGDADQVIVLTGLTSAGIAGSDIIA